jgi:hypothetical protein
MKGMPFARYAAPLGSTVNIAWTWVVETSKCSSGVHSVMDAVMKAQRLKMKTYVSELNWR